MRILFCKIGWMKYYKGVSEKDPIYNGGAFVRENGNGGEAYNFEAVSTEADGVNCYGFLRQNSKTATKVQIVSTISCTLNGSIPVPKI